MNDDAATTAPWKTAARKVEKEELPEIFSGTDGQVDWAVKLRHRILSNLLYWIRAEDDTKERRLAREILPDMIALATSRFWIDIRELSIEGYPDAIVAAKKREKQLRMARKWLDTHPHTELSGSFRQVIWATDLRLQRIGELLDDPALLAAHGDLLPWLADQSDVRIWIDFHEASTDRFFKNVAAKAAKALEYAACLIRPEPSRMRESQVKEPVHLSLAPAEADEPDAGEPDALEMVIDPLGFRPELNDLLRTYRFHYADDRWRKRLLRWEMPEERFVEISRTLLQATYPVHIIDEKLRERVRKAKFQSEVFEVDADDKDRFVIRSPYRKALSDQLNTIPGSAFSDLTHEWRLPTTAHETVPQLIEKYKFSFTEEAKQLLTQAPALMAEKEARERENLKRSADTDADIDVPVPEGLAYLSFQKAGIRWAAERFGTLLADEMGLGKTVEAAGLINFDPDINRVLVICPGGLTIHWQRELARWLVRPLSVGVAGKAFPDTDIVIISYTILSRHLKALHAAPWDLLTCDEAHFLTNPKAQRTKNVLGYWNPKKRRKEAEPIDAKKVLFLTGTPITNRPKNIWPLVHRLDPETFDRFLPFAERYCDAFEDRFGLHFDGASNLPELREKLRSTVMMRRLKRDVLAELPEKRRQLVEIPSTGVVRLVKKEMKLYREKQRELIPLRRAVAMALKAKDTRAYYKALTRLRRGTRVAFSEMSEIRAQVAEAKIPFVIEHLERFETDEKLILFAHHRKMIDALTDHFGERAVAVHGGVRPKDRQALVDRFQEDPGITRFIGSLDAAGTGFTLTASSWVIFAESSWVPHRLNQAEDRAHRVGQKNAVNIQHLVLNHSVDAHVMKTAMAKQEIIHLALDATEEHEML